MLYDLIPQRLRAGGVSLRLPLISLCYLESKGITYDDLRQGKNLAYITTAAIIGDFINKETVKYIIESGDFDFYDADGTYTTAGKWLDKVGDVGKAILMEVWLKSLPVPDIGADESNSSKSPDYKLLRCLYCDIMHGSEVDFWHSTMREVHDRWEKYAELKGYQEPVTQVRKYADIE